MKVERVFGVFRDRHPERARENMAQLVNGMRKFPERKLAGRVHDGAERAWTATR